MAQHQQAQAHLQETAPEHSVVLPPVARDDEASPENESGAGKKTLDALVFAEHNTSSLSFMLLTPVLNKELRARCLGSSVQQILQASRLGDPDLLPSANVLENMPGKPFSSLALIQSGSTKTYVQVIQHLVALLKHSNNVDWAAPQKEKLASLFNNVLQDENSLGVHRKLILGLSFEQMKLVHDFCSQAYSDPPKQMPAIELLGQSLPFLSAMSRSSSSVLGVPEALSRDKYFMLSAVKRAGHTLAYACEDIRNDKDVVMAAVKQNGEALRYASTTLRGDKTVVLAAVSENGRALSCASIPLRDDKLVVLAAVKQNPYALFHVSKRLKNDVDVLLTSSSMVIPPLLRARKGRA